MDRIITPAETANRAAIAIDLADALADMPHGTDPDALARMPSRGWVRAAQLAGCADDYVPSDETRRTVIAIVRRRNSEARADPFRGFPQ